VVADKRIHEIRQTKTHLYEPLGKDSPYGTIGFYKLDVFSIYEYDRVIYLDLDILIKHNISDLWNPKEFNKHTVYAFNEKAILELGHITNYYNFGVIVVNKNSMILNEDMYRTMIMFTNNRLPTKNEADKDILNFVLNGYPGLITVGDLPQEYNFFYSLIKTEEDVKHAKIIHFASFPKPWRIKNPQSNIKKLYYRVLTEI
jgi:lipopolysaccharide biosynthesis glycosyltransferase